MLENILQGKYQYEVFSVTIRKKNSVEYIYTLGIHSMKTLSFNNEIKNSLTKLLQGMTNTKQNLTCSS